MEMTLFGFAAFFLVIYGISLFRRRREQVDKVKFSQLFLVLLGALLMILALTVHAFTSAGFGQLEILSLAVSLPLALIGFWKMFSSQKPFNSHGFLGLGTAVVLIVASFAIPIYSQNLPQATPPLPIGLPGSSTSPTLPDGFPADFAGLPNLASNSSESDVSYPVQANVMLVVPTPVAPAQAIPTLEPPVLFFSSPTPTSDIVISCTAIVQTNLNLRDLPSTSAGAVIVIIDENTTVELIATEANGDWFYTQSDTNEGWLFGELLTLDATCDQLPVRNWN